MATGVSAEPKVASVEATQGNTTQPSIQSTLTREQAVADINTGIDSMKPPEGLPPYYPLMNTDSRYGDSIGWNLYNKYKDTPEKDFVKASLENYTQDPDPQRAQAANYIYNGWRKGENDDAYAAMLQRQFENPQPIFGSPFGRFDQIAHAFPSSSAVTGDGNFVPPSSITA